MAYKRILTIQDISCVGKCSMTVALPVLSACGHEISILPTAILSTHTGGFSKPAVFHMSEAMEQIRAHWKREGVVFDAICTGYLGSVAAVEATISIAEEFLGNEAVLVVDPAMADHGKCYSGLSAEYVEAMKKLCAKADILLPNITEAAMLSGIAYQDMVTAEYVEKLLEGVSAEKIVLTGVSYTEGFTGVQIKDGLIRQYYRHPRHPRSFFGTGDLFAASFVGAYMHGISMFDAASVAADFTYHAISCTVESTAPGYGVKFELALPNLICRLNKYL